MNLAIFDVCGTLYRTNTLFAFAAFLHAQRPGRVRLLHCRALKALDALTRLFGVSVRQRLALRLLGGMRIDTLQAQSVLFVNGVLRIFERPEAAALMASYRQSGYSIALFSAAPDVLLAPMGMRWGAQFVAGSPLRLSDGRCTGRLSRDLAGRKHLLLADLPPIRSLAVVTDNRSDLPLLERAQSRHVFARPRDVRFWLAHGIARDELIGL